MTMTMKRDITDLIQSIEEWRVAAQQELDDHLLMEEIRSAARTIFEFSEPMRNPAAIYSKETLNVFTRHVKANPNILVRLRNGNMVKVIFTAGVPEDFTSDHFHDENWNYLWEMDGTSVTSRNFDMIEIGK